jgi:hypothetical protein
MSRTVYRFEFAEGPDMKEVEETLVLSILAVGCLHGEPAVRLDAGYAVDPDRRVVAVDGTTDTGRAVTRVFAGLAIHEFGDDSFSVAQVLRPPPSSPAAASAQAEPDLVGAGTS